MKYWIVPDNSNPLENVVVGNTSRPTNTIALAPIDPDTNEPEDISVIDLIDELDDITGEPTGQKVAIVNQDKKAERIRRNNLSALEQRSLDRVRVLLNAKNDLAWQIQALFERSGGKASKFNALQDAINFAELIEYREGLERMTGTYHALVDNAGTLAIEEIPIGTKRSNILAIAPPGFVPGDEAYITWDPVGKKMTVDWDARIQKFKTQEKTAEETRKDAEWNNKNPLERIKDSILGG